MSLLVSRPCSAGRAAPCLLLLPLSLDLRHIDCGVNHCGRSYRLCCPPAALSSSPWLLANLLRPQRNIASSIYKGTAPPVLRVKLTAVFAAAKHCCYDTETPEWTRDGSTSGLVHRDIAGCPLGPCHSISTAHRSTQKVSGNTRFALLDFRGPLTRYFEIRHHDLIKLWCANNTRPTDGRSESDRSLSALDVAPEDLYTVHCALINSENSLGPRTILA